ncbi:MAG: hypothetical protein AB1626_00525 [Candidatus Micrarchaeota archaeon]
MGFRMAFDIIALASKTVFLLVLAALATAVLFPFVLLASFAYSSLVARYEKTPKFVWMLVVTFVFAFAALVLLEFYLGNALTQLLSMQCA